MKPLKAEHIGNVEFLRRLGEGWEGHVDLCRVTVERGGHASPILAVRKTVKPYAGAPEVVFQWAERMKELREGGLPVPRWSVARIRVEANRLQGELFMQPLDASRLSEVKSGMLDVRPVHLKVLRAGVHDALIRKLGVSLARLHRLGYPADFTDFWMFVRGEKVTPSGLVILDTGRLEKGATLSAGIEKSRRSLLTHVRHLHDVSVRRLFLDSYAGELPRRAALLSLKEAASELSGRN